MIGKGITEDQYMCCYFVLISCLIHVLENQREEIRAIYLGQHPNSFWITPFDVDFGDFQFLRIEPKVGQYVSGVATALLGSGEFSREEFSTAVVDPIYQFSKPITVKFAEILDVDSLGFNVKLLATVSMDKMLNYGTCQTSNHVSHPKIQKLQVAFSYSDVLASHITNTGFKQLKNEEKKKKIEAKKKKISALPADNTHRL